jgi:molybdopterin-synthase adenylyltransferase
MRDGSEESTMKIMFCGCGALGSWIAIDLASPRVTLYLLDDDVVSENNILNGTSAYSIEHIDAAKAIVLSELVYRKSQVIAHAAVRTLEAKDRAALSHYDLIIDTFDNASSRALTYSLDVPVLHAGVSLERTGMVMWDDTFPLPRDPIPRAENPICTHQAGRAIIRTTAVAATNILQHYLQTGEKAWAMTSERGIKCSL